MRRDSSSVPIVNSVTIFSVAFEEEHSVSFFAAGMVHIVEAMVLSGFLSGNGLQIYQLYIWLAKFLLQRFNILNTIEDIDWW